MSERHTHRRLNADTNGESAVFAVLFAIAMWVAYGLYRLFSNPKRVTASKIKKFTHDNQGVDHA